MEAARTVLFVFTVAVYLDVAAWYVASVFSLRGGQSWLSCILGTCASLYAPLPFVGRGEEAHGLPPSPGPCVYAAAMNWVLGMAEPPTLTIRLRRLPTCRVQLGILWVANGGMEHLRCRVGARFRRIDKRNWGGGTKRRL